MNRELAPFPSLNSQLGHNSHEAAFDSFDYGGVNSFEGGGYSSAQGGNVSTGHSQLHIASNYSRGYLGHPSEIALSNKGPLAIDDPSHFLHYPPYAVLYQQFISIKGNIRVLESQVASAQANADFLKTLVDRGPLPPVLPSAPNLPLAPQIPTSSSPSPSSILAANLATIRVSPEDDQRINTPPNRADFPSVTIWTKKEWKAEWEGKKDIGVKLHRFAFFVDENDDYVGESQVAALQHKVFTVWQLWVDLLFCPGSWKARRLDAVTHLKLTIAPGFPWVFYCEGGDWKLDAWATAVFPNFKRRIWKAYVAQLLLHGLAAPRSDSDDECDEDDTRDVNTRPAKRARVEPGSRLASGRHESSESRPGDKASQLPKPKPKVKAPSTLPQRAPVVQELEPTRGPQTEDPSKDSEPHRPLDQNAELDSTASSSSSPQQLASPDDFDFVYSRSNSPDPRRTTQDEKKVVDPSQKTPPPTPKPPVKPVVVIPSNPLATAKTETNPALTFVPPPPGSIVPKDVPANPAKKPKPANLEQPSTSYYTPRNLYLLDYIVRNGGKIPTKPEFKLEWDAVNVKGGEVIKKYTALAAKRKKEGKMQGELEPLPLDTPPAS